MLRICVQGMYAPLHRDLTVDGSRTLVQEASLVVFVLAVVDIVGHAFPDFFVFWAQLFFHATWIGSVPLTDDFDHFRVTVDG